MAAGAWDSAGHSPRAAKRSRGCATRPPPPLEKLVTAHSAQAGVEINAKPSGRQDEILSTEALGFLAGLHRRFNRQRLELLVRRRAWRERPHGGRKDLAA